MRAFGVAGRFVHGVAGETGKLEYEDEGVVVVDASGVISAVGRGAAEVGSIIARLNKKDPPVPVIFLARAQLLHPGLIDTHVHAPQYMFTGTATRLPLMEWLTEYTFPAEKRCADPAFAETVYKALVAKLISHGTTMAVYYGSIHLEATKALVDVCLAAGQRGIVGKVAMDQHGVEGYQETTEDSLADTERLIVHCYERQPGTVPETRLVNPAVVPRFIPTCSERLLKGLGALAAQYSKQGCWVQSHIAESPDEMAFVETLHPGRRDTDIFDRAGLLLARRTIMAHAVHLTGDELETMAARDAGIACCPLSNVFFAGGDFELRAAHRRGVRVGLGTDIAGGYSCSLLSGARHAVCASKCQGRGRSPAAAATELDYQYAFWTATLGGACAVGLEDHLGSFVVGKQFDAVVADCAGFDSFTTRELSSDFERYVNLGDDRHVVTVWVQGRVVNVQR